MQVIKKPIPFLIAILLFPIRPQGHPPHLHQRRPGHHPLHAFRYEHAVCRDFGRRDKDITMTGDCRQQEADQTVRRTFTAQHIWSTNNIYSDIKF